MAALYIGAGAVISSAVALYLSRKAVALAESQPSMIKRSLGTSQLEFFPWGSEAFDMKLMPAFMGAGAATVAAAIAITTPSGPITSLALARGPVLVTLVRCQGLEPRSSAFAL